LVVEKAANQRWRLFRAQVSGGPELVNTEFKAKERPDNWWLSGVLPLTSEGVFEPNCGTDNFTRAVDRTAWPSLSLALN
jgi:hypothetical protein